MEPLIIAPMAARVGAALRKRHPALGDATLDLTGEERDGRVYVHLQVRQSVPEAHIELGAAVALSPAYTRWQAVDVALDFLDWALGEVLGSGHAPLGAEFAPVRFGAAKLWARGSVRRPAAEAAARALLRAADEGAGTTPGPPVDATSPTRSS